MCIPCTHQKVGEPRLTCTLKSSVAEQSRAEQPLYDFPSIHLNPACSASTVLTVAGWFVEVESFAGSYAKQYLLQSSLLLPLLWRWLYFVDSLQTSVSVIIPLPVPLLNGSGWKSTK